MEFIPDFDLSALEAPIEEEETVKTVDTIEDEPEVVEGEIENEEEPGEEEESVEIDPNVQAIYDIYREEGILDEIKDFDGTYDGLKDALLERSFKADEEIFEGIVGAVAPDNQPVVELLLSKPDLSIDELSEFVENLKKPSEEIDGEQFLVNLYINKFGFDKEEAEDRIDNLKDKNKYEGELERRKKEIADSKKEQTQAQLQAVQEERKAARKATKEYVDTLSSTIMSSYSKPRARELIGNFRSGSFKQSIEAIVKDPKIVPHLLEFVSYYKDGKFDLDTYKKEAFTPSVREVQNKNRKYWSGNNTKGKKVDQDKVGLNLKNYEITLD